MTEESDTQSSRSMITFGGFLVFIISYGVGILIGIWLSVRFKIRRLKEMVSALSEFIKFLHSGRPLTEVVSVPTEELSSDIVRTNSKASLTPPKEATPQEPELPAAEQTVEPEVPELPPAVTMKGFRLKKKIASGGFASVYLASWTGLPDKDIAAKIIKLAKVDNIWVEKNLKNELDIHMSIKHENVVKVFDVIKTPTTAYIFMALAEKGSVADIIEKTKKPLSESTTQKYMMGIALAVSHLHKRDIVHRDIKPDNILVNAEDIPLLSDFGFACAADGNTKLMRGTMCGTEQYKAIEIKILEDGKVYDPKAADMYSYGISLFVMAFFDFPFDQHNEVKCIRDQKEMKFVFKEEVQKTSDSFKDLIAKLLVPDPQKRLTSLQTLRHSWFETK